MSSIHRMLAVLTALFAAVMFTVSTAGCSKKADEPLPEAAGLIQQSVAASRALQSAHLEIAVTGKVEGLPVKTLSADLTNVPSTAVQGNAKIVMGGSDIDAELVVLDGTLYAALTPDNWLDMGPAADIYDPSVILDPNTGLANMLAALSDTTAEGFETISGVPAVRITGTASPDSVNKLIPQLKATGPLPATVWIEKSAPHQLVQAQVEQSPGNTVALTLSEWDKPVTVTKPAV
jgi:lipoprotein LprG